MKQLDVNRAMNRHARLRALAAYEALTQFKSGLGELNLAPSTRVRIENALAVEQEKALRAAKLEA